ncbi:MAG: hypothetical protein KJO55_03980 [Gammaproteobacteria bacterium]|nr:hypothetical protein [Gammaproteobacteria bacterium]NND60511.1 hypothetical protein [Gammaproteobacteria bacterium]
MLNSPGDDFTNAELTNEPAEPGQGPVMMLGQILLIGIAGVYLFAMVWLYMQVPWLGMIVTLVALGVIVAGVMARINEGPASTPDR